MPEEVKQWRKEIDFHLVPLRFNLETARQYNGAVQFESKMKLTGGRGVNSADIADVGPQNEWKERAVKGSVELGFEVAKALGGSELKFISEGLTAKGTFTYEWKPVVAAVVSGHAGQSASWVLRRSEGKYLDGGHEFLILVRRPRRVENLKLTLTETRALYDLPWPFPVEAVVKEKMDIDILFQPSTTD